jgi:hypothetical protein
MFMRAQIDEIAAGGGFSRDIQQSEIEEVIDYATECGVLSDAVAAWSSKGSTGIRLELRLSDEVAVVSGDLGREQFIRPGDDGTKRENIEYVLNKAVEILKELKEAATQSRQADWRGVRIFG